MVARRRSLGARQPLLRDEEVRPDGRRAPAAPLRTGVRTWVWHRAPDGAARDPLRCADRCPIVTRVPCGSLASVSRHATWTSGCCSCRTAGPTETFDLIVLSEVLYYFTPERCRGDPGPSSGEPRSRWRARRGALPCAGRGTHDHRGRGARADRRVGRIRALLALHRAGLLPRRVPAPVIPTAIAIGIPARDEARRIGACLASIARAARRVGIPVTVVVAADSCTDRTASIGEGAARGSRRRALWGHVIEVNAATVGGVCEAACLAAVAATGRPLAEVWLATTDADTTVAPDWLVAQMRWAEAGVDGVAGLVRVDSELPDRTASPGARVSAAAGRRDRTRPRLWGEPRARAPALDELGGFAPLAVGEDQQLWDGRPRSRSPLARCRRCVGHDQRRRGRPHTERVRRLPGRPRVVSPIAAQASDG